MGGLARGESVVGSVGSTSPPPVSPEIASIAAYPNHLGSYNEACSAYTVYLHYLGFLTLTFAIRLSRHAEEVIH